MPQTEGGVVRRDPTTGDVTTAPDARVTDLSRQECLAEIASRVGLNIGTATRVPKRGLNSIHWALTGETFAAWKRFGSADSPDGGDLRRGVALNAGFHYPYDRTTGARHSDEAPDRPRPFNLPELRALVYALRTREDQRPHSG